MRRVETSGVGAASSPPGASALVAGVTGENKRNLQAKAEKLGQVLAQNIKQ